MVVLAYGELTPLRCSKCNADVAHVDSLEKAEKRVAVKNLKETQGKPIVNSVCAFSNILIEQNLGRVGISLGDSEILRQESIALIKDVERNRLKPSNF
jgi:CHASE3 domain sensor protein